MSDAAVAKYRPVLTMLEMQYLISLINMAQDGTETGKTIKYKFGKIMFSVDAGVASPAYVANPRQSVLARLEDIPSSLTPEQKREAAYIKYKGTPTECTNEEVMLARTYMYSHNMFSDEERAQYESDYLE